MKAAEWEVETQGRDDVAVLYRVTMRGVPDLRPLIETSSHYAAQKERAEYSSPTDLTLVFYDPTTGDSLTREEATRRLEATHVRVR